MHAGDVGFVMHCFCGDTDTALAVVDAGGHVSFTGNLTFKRNEALRETARALPLESLLLETDCPYMAPVPKRGKRCEPQYVEYVRPTPSGSSACPSVLRKHNQSMKKLAVLLAAAPLLLCAPLASSADASSAGDPGAFVLSEAEVDQMARNTHDFNQAIAAGNAADVRRLLSTGITPNIVLARVLLDAQGIDVNMENRHGETPLMLAVIKGREAEFDRLLKLGAKVNKTRGWTPLHYAATEGRTSMMKRLIELGADVNAQTKAGITALDMAARKPSREAVMMLLRAGAYRDYCTDRGMSAADFAKKAGDEELAKYLAVKACAVTGPARPELYRQPAGITLRH